MLLNSHSFSKWAIYFFLNWCGIFWEIGDFTRPWQIAYLHMWCTWNHKFTNYCIWFFSNKYVHKHNFFVFLSMWGILFKLMWYILRIWGFYKALTNCVPAYVMYLGSQMLLIAVLDFFLTGTFTNTNLPE